MMMVMVGTAFDNKVTLGADSGKVDMATVMAEMFQKGDQ